MKLVKVRGISRNWLKEEKALHIYYLINMSDARFATAENHRSHGEI